MDDPLLDLWRLVGVPSGLEAARSAADAVLRDRGLRAVPPAERARALLHGAAASAELAAGDPLAPGEPRRDWRAGAVRVSTQLGELAPLVRGAPGQALTRVHTLLARGVLPDAQVGRVRPEVADRVLELTRLLGRRSAAPSLLTAAVAHAEVATLLPFAAGNGVVARALEHLVLVADGVDPVGVLVPEAGHRDAAVDYRRALAGYATGSLGGVRDWLLHVARALAAGAETTDRLRRAPGAG
ncbi:oxidoreductase [Desertihabitans brevis]|uniref:Oxidoreductase n=1 Tax=Desertihabitans brevis TaxID=2268447 RepID=A0A367YUN0_9ACTN|nr:Fic family protein [Desertihabitans brevis]RCK69239.1 oxidoreductase [Desertihabitans brevis]